MSPDNPTTPPPCEMEIPFFWPLGFALKAEEKILDLERKNLKFLDEVILTQKIRPKPEWATPNKVLYDLRALTLRDFSQKASSTQRPTLILPPYAGHTSTIADFHEKQSLVEVLLKHGIERVFVTEWHSATPDMKDLDIDHYLAELHTVVSDLGAPVHLIGLCQGGWFASLYAARFPQNVQSLTVAGAPIDTQAGEGAIKHYVNTLPFSFYEELVAKGGGLLRGEYMLQGFKNMHPKEQYLDKYVRLYAHIDDPSYVTRTEIFERWYEATVDLPGRWYLQAVKDLFTENQFAKGQFVALGRQLDPKTITCPVYLLAGDKDDITPAIQVFNASLYFGTSKEDLHQDLATGGHIGLFMGTKPLAENWPKIADFLKKADSRK